MSRGLQRTEHGVGAAQEGGAQSRWSWLPCSWLRGLREGAGPQERLVKKASLPQEPSPHQLSQAEDFTLLLPDPGLEAPRAHLIPPASSLSGQETEAREGRGYRGHHQSPISWERNRTRGSAPEQRCFRPSSLTVPGSISRSLKSRNTRLILILHLSSGTYILNFPKQDASFNRCRHFISSFSVSFPHQKLLFN